MIRSFPPHPNPLPPGERVGHSSPQQSWGVFWHILINPKFKGIILEINSKIKQILTLVNISLKRDFRNGKLAYRF
jgi:hypothetical protein